MKPAPEPAPNADTVAERERFEHRGKSYLLFKQSKRPGAPWYFHFQHAKRRHKKCLETNVKRIAADNARAFIDQVVAGKWEALRALRPATRQATIGEVIKAYTTRAACKPNTIRANVWALRFMLRSVGLSDASPAAALTWQVVRRFQDALLAEYERKAISEKMDPREARERSLRSSRSLLRQARSIFSRKSGLLAAYAEDGLCLPDLTDFLGGKLRGRAIKTEYHAPDDAIIKATFDGIEELRETNPRVFLAFWLAVGAGLRRGEIRRLDWSQVIDRDGDLWISGGIGKDGERIEIKVQSRAAEKLRPFREAAGPVVGRSDRWVRALNYWMISKGWRTEKKMHELRAYVGSLIYQLNPVAAMRFLRHKSIRVTEQFYCHYGTQAKAPDVL